MKTFFGQKKVPTEREIKLLGFLAEGFTAKQIGKLMCFNYKTIERHILELRADLDAINTTHLISIAYKEKYLK